VFKKLVQLFCIRIFALNDMWKTAYTSQRMLYLQLSYPKYYKMKHTFCWHSKVSVHSRHFESNTKTKIGLLNVTLSLDTVNIHVIFDHVIHGSRMENGISHWTSDTDTSRASVKKISKVNCISWNTHSINEV